MPKPGNPNKKENNEFKTENFKCDKENDIYTCPNEKILGYKSKYTKNGKVFKRYHNYESCKRCEFRDRCTKSKKNGRVIDRWEHQEIIDKVEKQTKESWDKYRKRQWLSEHPFGTIKRGFDAYYVLTKGIESVGAEIGLVCLAYNLKRVMKIFGIKKLKSKLAAI